MRNYVKRGDIYFVAGGAVTGSEQGGDRPAIIVSNNVGNKHAPIVEVVYLTARKKTRLPTHVYINSSKRPSIALCEQVTTIDKSRLERRFGRVTAKELRAIDRAIARSLGLNG